MQNKNYIMKSYLKAGRTVALTALLVSLTLYSCNKQENVDPASKQKALDTENVVVTSKAFVVGEKGKQILLSEFKKQVASKANKSNARSTSGRVPVPRELVDQYTINYGGAYNPRTIEDFVKRRFSSLRPHGIHRFLDGVSFGAHQFAAGVNASQSSGWKTYVNYDFKEEGSRYELEGSWQAVNRIQVSAPSHRSITLNASHRIGMADITVEKSSSVTKTNTHGLDLGLKVGATFAKIYTLEASVNYSFSSSTATMEGKSISVTHKPMLLSDITIPQGKTCDLVLEQQQITGVQRYKVKAWFDGLVGGNYNRRVYGSYFWSCLASRFFREAHDKYQELKQNETYPAFRYVLRNCR